MPDLSEPNTNSSLIRNVRVPDRDGAFDVFVTDGLVSDIRPTRPGSVSTAKDQIDGQGALALPAMVDGHVHLDKTFLGIDWVPHLGDDTVKSRIAVEKALRQTHADTLTLRATHLARKMSRFGTTDTRTHVDIDDINRLSSFEAIMTVRDQMQDVLDIQIVAFPQSGLAVSSSVLADLETALKSGADVLGGLDPTTIDGDAKASLDNTFGLADRMGVGIDIHLHEPGEMGASVIVQICQRTKALGFGGKVVVSHGFCLADVSQDRLGELADLMADAGVALMTGVPGPGALVPIAELHARGVGVFAASDNVRDAWAPSGNGDMLDRARLLAYRADFRTDDALDFAFLCATQFPAEILGFRPRGAVIGHDADLVLLAAPSVRQAVCDVPAQRRVIRKGRLISS